MTAGESASVAERATLTVPAETEVKVQVLSGIHTQINHVNDPVIAEVLKPVFVEGKLALPPGSLLDGHITMIRNAGHMHRSAELGMRFDRITLPDGQEKPVAAVLAALEHPEMLDIHLDPEGHLTSNRTDVVEDAGRRIHRAGYVWRSENCGGGLSGRDPGASLGRSCPDQLRSPMASRARSEYAARHPMPPATELSAHRPHSLVSTQFQQASFHMMPSDRLSSELIYRCRLRRGLSCWKAGGWMKPLTSAGQLRSRPACWKVPVRCLVNCRSGSITNPGNIPDGAAIGFLSYELARHIEPAPRHACIPCPMFPSPTTHASSAFRVEHALRHHAAEHCSSSNPPLISKCTRRAVERIRSYIAAGDIYQANLTIPFCAELGDEPPESIYRRMRCSGAPFRAFLKTPDRAILSNSPERFFRVAGNQILTSPIKGTIARDRLDLERSVAALLASEKDRAENLMIVDLLRNDLGRICDFSSIRARLWETEVLPQLIHLVSHVEGTLRPGAGILEILRALFPCGSITGAPKIRAMEILAEIEQAPRGVSMGAIGIIRSTAGRDRCRMDFNVAIRTMIIEEGKALFNVGGGIVYDSDPVAEYAEVMLKAQPLFDALGAKAEETQSVSHLKPV